MGKAVVHPVRATRMHGAMSAIASVAASWLPFLLKEDVWRDWNDRFMAALSVLIAAELACLTLIAALPLDHWLEGLHRRSPEVWVKVVGKLQAIPWEMHYYFKLHALSLLVSMLMYIGSQSVYGFPACLQFHGGIFRWSMLGGLTTLNGIAVWNVFALMRDLTVNAFKRYEVRVPEDTSSSGPQATEPKHNP